MNRHSTPAVNAGVLLGGAVIVFGAVLLLENVGVLPGRFIPSFWAAGLIFFGLVNLTGSGGPSTRMWGAAITVAGVYWALDDFGLVSVPLGKLWPAALIAVGAMLLWRALGRGRDGPVSGDDIARLNEFAMFGGVDRKINSQDFRGGQLFAAFGGHEIDLKQARLATSPVTIDASVIFGGIDIKIPEDWSVSVEGVAIFGGYEDATIQPKIEDPARARRLIVKGVAIFGGVEVKN